MPWKIQNRIGTTTRRNTMIDITVNVLMGHPFD
jgi:hypothetical protein